MGPWIETTVHTHIAEFGFKQMTISTAGLPLSHRVTHQSINYNNQIIVDIIFFLKQSKIPNFVWFQLFECENLCFILVLIYYL